MIKTRVRTKLRLGSLKKPRWSSPPCRLFFVAGIFKRVAGILWLVPQEDWKLTAVRCDRCSRQNLGPSTHKKAQKRTHFLPLSPRRLVLLCVLFGGQIFVVVVVMDTFDDRLPLCPAEWHSSSGVSVSGEGHQDGPLSQRSRVPSSFRRYSRFSILDTNFKMNEIKSRKLSNMAPVTWALWGCLLVVQVERRWRRR